MDTPQSLKNKGQRQSGYRYLGICVGINVWRRDEIRADTSLTLTGAERGATTTTDKLDRATSTTGTHLKDVAFQYNGF